MTVFEMQDQVLKDKRTLAEKAVDNLAMYANFETLTREILCALVDRIEVFESQIVDGTAEQTVKIFYRFVGLISPVEFGATRLYHFGGVTNPTAKRAARKRSDKKMEERIRLVQEEAANSPVVPLESPKNTDLPEREAENGSP